MGNFLDINGLSYYNDKLHTEISDNNTAIANALNYLSDNKLNKSDESKYYITINGTINGDSNANNLGTIFAPVAGGTSGQYLKSNGNSAPTWANFPTIPTSTSQLTNDSGFVTIDTKNTAGATDSSSKLFLIGATSQAANPQTYSHDTVYIGANGKLYSNSIEVINLSDTQALTNKTYNGYTLAAACAKNVDTSISSTSSTNLPTSAAITSYITNIQKTEQTSTATSVTISSMANNIHYIYGTLTSLTINGFSTSESSKINTYSCEFDSGSTATTLSIPSAVIWSEEPSIESGKHYEINIKYNPDNNLYYGLIASWNIPIGGTN